MPPFEAQPAKSRDVIATMINSELSFIFSPFMFNSYLLFLNVPTLNIGFEYILAYSKLDYFSYNPVFKEASEQRQNIGYWKGFWNAPNRPTMRYDILGFIPEEGQWKWKQEVAKEAVENYKVFAN